MKDFKINLKKAILDTEDFKGHELESELQNKINGGGGFLRRAPFKLVPHF